MRVERSLNGEWQFQLDPEGTLTPDTLQPDRQITVPMPWQAVFPELEHYSGSAWYRRTFVVDEDALDGELILHFGAVDYWTSVYVNGQHVGEHEGGYTAFDFTIRPVIHAGENTLDVRVYDTVQTGIVVPRWREGNPSEPTQPPLHAETIPHGKQTWYVDVSGIWQDVTLIMLPKRYIQQVHVTPNIGTGEAHIAVTVAGVGDAGVLRAEINGIQVEAAVDGDSEGVNSVIALSLSVSDPRLWTPDTPALYTAVVSLETSSGKDEINTRFGFRELRTEGGYLLLNGEPLYLLSALDQDIYPDTIYTVPSDDFLRDQFRKTKELGFNSLRCHIKPPDPRYLDLADEMGLIIWAEIPSWRTFYPKMTARPSALYLDDRVKARAHETLEAMIARDYNHPSLMIWTIINEDWGTSLLLSPSDRAWVVQMVDACKRLDPTRLVVDNSPCPAPWGLSVHVKSDLDDFHIYTNIPDQAEQFEQFAEQFGSRPLWSFSNTGDAQRTGNEPLLLSEFGNWGMPSLSRYGNDEPEWFDLGGWWSSWEGDPSYPAGVVDRFERLGLGAIWSSYDAFTTASQWHEFYALKFEIETLRRQGGIQGYVVTELCDIYWESNGLLDFARGEKAFHRVFNRINALDMIIPHLRRYAFWDDEMATMRLHASHYSGANWQGATAQVHADASTPQPQPITVPVGDIARGKTKSLGTVKVPMARVNTSVLHTLNFSVTAESDGQGTTTLAQNDVRVLVLPARDRHAAYTGQVAAIMRSDQTEMPSWMPAVGTESAAFAGQAATTTPTPAISEPVSEAEIAELAVNTPSFAHTLRRFGYQAQSQLQPGKTNLLITDHPDADTLDWVRAGGDMLYLSIYPASPFFWRQSRGGAYGGSWITSFSWLRTDIHRRLRGVENPLTLPFMDVMPYGAIVGLPTEDTTIQPDFLAGQFTGWVNHPALHTVQFRYGAGRVVMTTFRLRETIVYQPVALAMLHDLIDHLTSEACQPILKANYS